MNRTQTVQTMIWLDQIAAAAKAQRAELAAGLEDEARDELEHQGTVPTWRMTADDAMFATVVANMSHAATVVADEALFTKWVQQHYPAAVILVPTVVPAWREKFLADVGVDRSEPSGRVVVIDRETGAIVPGVTRRRGGECTGISVRPTPAAKDLFGQLAANALITATAQLGIAATAETPELVATP
jgi:hypothetical protein